MAQDNRSQSQAKRKAFVVAYPANWDELSDEQKKAAALAMAREARRQAGK